MLMNFSHLLCFDSLTYDVIFDIIHYATGCCCLLRNKILDASTSDYIFIHVYREKLLAGKKSFAIPSANLITD